MHIVAWLEPVTLYVAHTCIYIIHICPSDIRYMWHVFPVWWPFLFLVHTGGWHTFSCVLAYMCKNMRSICSFSMLVVWAIFAMWSHISLMLYVYSAPCHMVNGRYLLCINLMAVPTQFMWCHFWIPHHIRPNRTLSTGVSRKPTYTDQYIT